ncbi:DUF488 domain-containing protein [Pedobacter arcticus]|uniref:DUF488 domain-containing protein n=1 Tax=Pedobacter arcticus TaxID=752140 RepID=UPI0002FA9736|nr:DUF488 domain-containing protein [Pedobacter arcticus]
MNHQQKTIWTVGHSTHSANEFLSILQHYHIELLVDVRRFPGSRKFPWFNQNVLKSFLSDNGINYVHLGDLGGRRKPSVDSVNTVWRHPAFRAYADFMESDEFKVGIKELQELASVQKTVIMCSEVLWWRCHRSMIADYLKAHDWEVMHILSIEKSTEHPYTQPAKIENGGLTYH